MTNLSSILNAEQPAVQKCLKSIQKDAHTHTGLLSCLPSQAGGVELGADVFESFFMCLQVSLSRVFLCVCQFHETKFELVSQENGNCKQTAFNQTALNPCKQSRHNLCHKVARETRVEVFSLN